MRLNEMTTTIHDVARIAGVGTGTVSRVINNSAGVKPATRKKVLSAIAQLNYRPNPIARSMISKQNYCARYRLLFLDRAKNLCFMMSRLPLNAIITFLSYLCFIE